MSREIRVSDDRPCVVQFKGEDVEAILHPFLSRTDMAKVEMADGRWKDVAWWNVTTTDAEERMDVAFGVGDAE